MKIEAYKDGKVEEEGRDYRERDRECQGINRADVLH